MFKKNNSFPLTFLILSLGTTLILLSPPAYLSGLVAYLTFLTVSTLLFSMLLNVAYIHRDTVREIFANGNGKVLDDDEKLLNKGSKLFGDLFNHGKKQLGFEHTAPEFNIKLASVFLVFEFIALKVLPIQYACAILFTEAVCLLGTLSQNKGNYTAKDYFSDYKPWLHSFALKQDVAKYTQEVIFTPVTEVFGLSK